MYSETVAALFITLILAAIVGAICWIETLIGSNAFIAVLILMWEVMMVPATVYEMKKGEEKKKRIIEEEKKRIIEEEKEAHIKRVKHIDDAAKYLKNISGEIEDSELANDVKEISTSIAKIKEAVENNPHTYESNKKVFTYYIPTTLRLIKKYDEIENQNMTNDEVQTYMKKTKSVFRSLNNTYQKMLFSFYSKDIIDQTADIEVLSSLLKAENQEEMTISK